MINSSSDNVKKLNSINRRMFIFAAAKAVIFCGIVGRLFTLQISDNKKIKIYDIKTLDVATNKDITFFNSNRYINKAKLTKAVACITTKNLSQFLPKKCVKIYVRNVLYSTAKISKKFANPKYLNIILKIISYHDPLSLLNICKKIEINLGRKKSKKNSSMRSLFKR